MADRLDYFFRQKVTEAELDLGFELLEQADRDFANDIGVFGIIDGMVASEKAGVPDLTVDLTAPGRAYDQLGQRIFFGTAQNVSLATDLNGVSTAVQAAGNEKIVSLFIKFDRALSDPRTDGNSLQVFFRRDESFKFVVRQGAEAAASAAVPPPLQADELLIVDLTRAFGQTQLLNADLSPNPTVPGDVGRRQDFVFAEANAISVLPGGLVTLLPTTNDVQATIQEIDDELTDHFGAAARRHDATHVDAAGATGATFSLTAGTVRTQLNELLAHVNAVEGIAAGTPPASAVTTTTGPNWLGGRTNPAAQVQAQLDKIVNNLGDQTGGDDGADRIGAQAVSGSPDTLAAGSVSSQLAALLQFVNQRANPTLQTLWSNTQVMNGPAAEEQPSIDIQTDPISRKLVWQANGSSFKKRLYYTDEEIHFTVNARWNGSQWERDSTGFFASRYILGRFQFKIQHLSTVVAQPFDESDWNGSNASVWAFNLDNIPNGDTITMGAERTVPATLSGYSATEGYFQSSANIGGGASFSSGRLPADPSSITFNVESQSGTDSSPSSFVSRRQGVGWFDTTTSSTGTKFMFLTFTAS